MYGYRYIGAGTLLLYASGLAADYRVSLGAMQDDGVGGHLAPPAAMLAMTAASTGVSAVHASYAVPDPITGDEFVVWRDLSGNYANRSS
jgi:hypothetical protein